MTVANLKEFAFAFVGVSGPVVRSYDLHDISIILSKQLVTFRTFAQRQWDLINMVIEDEW